MLGTRVLCQILLAGVIILATISVAQTTYYGAAGIVGAEQTYRTCNPRTGVCNPPQYDTGTITLTVNGSNVSTGYGEGSTPETIAASLCSQMTSSFPAQCTTTNGTTAAHFVNFQAKANYSVSSTVTKTCPPDYCGIPFSVIAPAGKVDPKYYILSLLYAPPGNDSSNGYSNSTTYGTTTTVSQSFQEGVSTTFTTSAGFLGSGGTLGWTFGSSTMTGSSEAFGWTVSDGQGVALNAVGPSNAINHSQDTFVIWLNPEVTFEPTSTNAMNYGIGTPPQSTSEPDPGAPQGMDVVTVSVAELQNPGLIPASVLGSQHLADGEVLPGLSSICANPNACVASDFTAIVQSDPLVGFSPTQNPTSVNGANNTRFVEIYSAELLSGPPYQGADPVSNSFTASDSTQTTDTWTGGYSYTTGFSIGGNLNFLGFGGISATNTTTFTWSYSESVGDTDGQTHEMNINLESTTVGCSEDIAVFEDTMFHTFAFQQPTGNTSCP
jgi:hypothetical protein